MKKTTRLTALLLALVLLLGTLSASATETTEGIPVTDLDAASYGRLKSNALTHNLLAEGLCGADNPYCAHVTQIIGEANAEARYVYMTLLEADVANFVLTHYYQNHSAEGVLCTCMGATFDAAYKPGAEVHQEGCPWHADNLVIFTYCNGDGVACGYNEFITMNGFKRHAYFKEHVNKLVDNAVQGDIPRTWYSEFIGDLSMHVAWDEPMPCCTCYDSDSGVYLYDTNYENLGYGSTSHKTDCSWHFSQLPLADQYLVIKDLSAEEQAEYTAKLSQTQYKELMELLGACENPEITAPEWDGKSEEVTLSFTIPGASSYVWEQGLFSYSMEPDANGNYTWIDWTVIEGQNGPTLAMDAAVDTLKYLYRCTAKTEEGTTIATSAEQELVKSEIRQWAAVNEDYVTDEMIVRAVKAGGIEVMVLEGNELIYVKAGGPVATYNPETHELIDSYLGVAVAKYDPETGKMTSLYNAE